MPTHFEIFINAFSEAGMRSRELDGDFVICTQSRLFDNDRIRKLTALYSHLMERKIL